MGRGLADWVMGGEVIARVVVRVALPGVPALIDRVVPVEVTVRSEQVDIVDAFRPRGSVSA